MNLGIDDSSYESYGRIIPGLITGDRVKLSTDQIGIIQDFPKKYYANIRINNEVKLIHLSNIDERLK